MMRKKDLALPKAGLAIAQALVYCCIAVSAEPSDDLQVRERRDNSGRQLAVSVPLPPPTVVPAAVPISVKKTASAVKPAVRREVGSSSAPEERVKAAVQSVMKQPFSVPPEMQQAAEKGAVVAQGLGKIAWRRFSDVAGWLSRSFKNLNDVPAISPFIGPVVKQPPVGKMAPISEPDHNQELYYTNEGRLRTVVGR